jgi:hypothetical protein
MRKYGRLAPASVFKFNLDHPRSIVVRSLHTRCAERSPVLSSLLFFCRLEAIFHLRDLPDHARLVYGIRRILRVEPDL